MVVLINTPAPWVADKPPGQAADQTKGGKRACTWAVSVCWGVWVLLSGVRGAPLPSVVVVRGSTLGRVGPVLGPDILSGISGAGEGSGFSRSPACRQSGFTQAVCQVRCMCLCRTSVGGCLVGRLLPGTA